LEFRLFFLKAILEIPALMQPALPVGLLLSERFPIIFIVQPACLRQMSGEKIFCKNLSTPQIGFPEKFKSNTFEIWFSKV